MSELEPSNNLPDSNKHEPEVRLGREEATKAFGWTVLFSIGTKLVFPLIGLYISRTLGPGPMGAYGLLLTIIGFSEIIRDAGLSQTYLADPTKDPRKDEAYFTVALITGAIPAIILLAGSSWAAEFFQQPDLEWSLRFAAFIMVLNGAATVPRAKMLRAGHLAKSGFYDIVASGTGLALAIILVSLGFGFKALVAQLVYGAILAFLAVWVRYPVKRVYFSIESFRLVGRKSLSVMSANALNNIFLLSDQIVISKNLGPVFNGYFTQALNLCYKPMDLLIFPLTRTLMVAFSQSSDDQERLRRMYGRSLTAAILTALPIYVFLGLFAEPVILLLLGEKFRGSIPVVSTLCIYLSFRVLGNISGHALVPIGKHFYSFFPWLLALASTGILLVFALPMKQLMPIVWSFTVGAIIVYATIFAFGLKFCRPPDEQLRRIGQSLAVLGIIALITAGLALLPLPGLAKLLVAAIVIPVCHLAAIGTIFAKDVLRYLRLRGPKLLWAEL
jgi:O-antigen/teichoic acid export membrane protein